MEDTSCHAFRNGWMMVDGSTVPIFARPHHFGNSFFDRKHQYSMNVQIISSPTLDILDYGVGLPGSQHDATAWQLTQLIEEHHIWLGEGEWVWADTAYPLDDWVITIYKRPEKLQVDNATFNYWVSWVHMRSKHCIGFLKGQFNSLRGLWIQINSQ